MAAVGGEGLFPVSRRSWQPEATGSVPERGASPLASSDSPTQPAKPVDLGPLPRATRRPAPRGLHPAPVPTSALRRQASEVRTVCVKRASTGLCGGCRAIGIPTATVRKEQLVKHWEGETMEIDVKRKVPPGDKFYEWYRK